MEENLNPPEDRDNNRDNNRDNWSRDNHPRDSRDNQPVSYTESYRRMNERKLREEALRGERAEREERLKRQDGFKTNHSFNSSKNNSINNIQRDNSSSIHFENKDSRFSTKADNSPRNFNRVERGFNTGNRSTRKIEKWIIVAVYVIVILAAIYFILATFFPGKMPFSKSVYEIKASDSKMFTALDSFYIDDQSVLGDKVQIDNITVRPIISSKKFNFVFAPKENIPEGKNATFELNLLLNSTNFSSIYINEQLVFPDLTNYELIKETDTDYIYVNKDITPYLNQDNFVEVDTTEDFIYQNMPGASVWATRELNSVNVRLKDYKKENTLINGTFRGSLKLAVYAEGSLEISFTKQDLNSYLGADEYVINVTDFAGNVVYTNLFEDDGINEQRSLGKEQEFNIKLDHLVEGVYYVNFIRDNNNEATDSTLKNIMVNTNKVLILGTFLPIKPFNFYTRANFPKKIGFYYWWGGKDQIVYVSGTRNKIVNLTKELINQRYDGNFSRGEYVLGLEKGYLWVYNDFSSTSKSSWFNLPSNPPKNLDNPDIIVIDKYRFNNALGIFNYTQDVDFSKTPVKLSLRVLEQNSASLKDANLILK